MILGLVNWQQISCRDTQVCAKSMLNETVLPHTPTLHNSMTCKNKKLCLTKKKIEKKNGIE